MASTGAVLYLKPRMAATESPGRRSGSVFYVPFRVLSGLWTAVGVNASADLLNLTAWLPPQRQPVLDANGCFQPSWYRALQFVFETKLGGINGPTLPDVAAAATVTQAASAVASAQVAAITTQTQTNAEALSVVVQVAQNNSLTGADQIPPVRLTPYEDLP